ncbi:hypothetical protein [Oceanobacillus sp. J11TS1]|uniref:hypothetical protein n=1 Tax=Oceanobacillus sp. J11TS1 TaxID=2807191 RepID=UPI001B22CE0C|nr:hypothetical protein [Oceanobacillus sp. J11TS1]GIO24119.1 hypothetical protein J11TS1_27000 [Oceanobacillus sp. J11TS1]
MVAQYEIRDKVLEYIEMLAMSPVKSLYPTAVAKYVNTPVKDIFPHLIDLVKVDELHLKWEIRCLNFDCHQTVCEVDTRNQLESEELSCPKCGHEFGLNERDIFPRFDLNPSYKEYIRRKKVEKTLIDKQALSLHL